MDKENKQRLLAALYLMVLDEARLLRTGSLCRLLDLHTRYPDDLPAEAIESLLGEALPPAANVRLSTQEAGSY